MNLSTRDACPDDIEAVVALLPRLADYSLPARRESEMFWGSDAALARRWSAGDAPESFIRVGVDADDGVVAVAIVTMNRDHFSGESNAHLEAIAVDPAVDGQGLGRRLIAEVEAEAKSRGALTMSLHVVGNNHRARAVYKKLGYDEEMIRAIRFLD